MENNNIALITKRLNIVEFEPENIKKLIYKIRGKQVMLDEDIAMLYNYKAKEINREMKKNKERFPEDFCFKVTSEEIKNTFMYLPKKEANKSINYAYTEYGIAMLAGILKGEIVVQASIAILRTFKQLTTFKFHKDSYFKI